MNKSTTFDSTHDHIWFQIKYFRLKWFKNVIYVYVRR